MEAIHYTDEKVVKGLSTQLKAMVNEKEEIVIVCIGTDRSTGDSLGPLVGTYLEQAIKNQENVTVFGTLHEPVHATNLKEKLEEIKLNHANKKIIAIDACLGRMANVGKIKISENPLKPGAAVNKDLPEVGDISINGIVNIGGMMEYFVLQNTRLSVVMDMATTIGEIIKNALTSIEENKKTLA